MTRRLRRGVRVSPRLAIAVVLAVVAGCGERIRDGGTACIGEEVGVDTGFESEVAIDADVAGQVLVVFSTCSSGSVDWRRAGCEATVDGRTVTVRSRVRRVPPLFSQTADCNRITTRCAHPPLDAGAWTLEYGDDTSAFDVPYFGPMVCAGQER